MSGQIDFKVFGVLVVALALSAPAAASAEMLRIGGTGGDLGTMRQLGEAFQNRHAGVTVDVFPSLGSGVGIKAVLAGAINIGLSARPLKATERDAGKSHLGNLG